MGNFNYSNIQIIDKKEILELYFNRPEKLNAINSEMLNEILDFFENLGKEIRVKGVILRGKNGNFCAGGDLNEIYKFKKEDALNFHRNLNKIVKSIINSDKIFVAVYEGYALGAGFEISLFCDIRIASKKSKIGYPGLRYNLIGAAGGSVMLPRIVGRSNAIYLILCSLILDPERAKQIGIVQEVYDDNELEKRIEEIEGLISSFDSKVIKHLKESINSSFNLENIESLIEMEAERYAEICEMEDTKKRILKFLNKK
jgi:Enoyl-CoA hydratase/carnithine racemase